MPVERALVSALAVALLLSSGWLRAQENSTGIGDYRGAIPTEYPDWFKESFLEFADDVAEAAAADRRIMIMFHQNGCPYCNLLVTRNLAQRDIEQYMRRHFEVVALNMWGDREIVTVAGKAYTEKTFASALKVQFTPTLVFLDERGKVALRLNGYLPPGEFKLALRYVATHQEQQQSYNDYMNSQVRPVSTERLITEPFFAAPPFDLAAARQDKPLAVFFEQRQCPNCAALHETVLSDAGTRELLRQFDAVQLDMWSDTPVITPSGRSRTAHQWAQELGVSYAPSIVLFDRSGAEVIRSEAYFRIFHTQSLLDYVLNQGFRHEPSFQRFISERAEQLREKGIDVDIWR